VADDPSDETAVPESGDRTDMEQLRAAFSSLQTELRSRMLELEQRSLEVHHLKLDLAVKEQFIESLEGELLTGTRDSAWLRFLRRALWRVQSLRPTPTNEPTTTDSNTLRTPRG
jgi:hypothetical protein